MTEYWKSQPKKWCEFCRCWITDNKASVQFHERGDGHKAQVARRLSELTRKGEQDYRAQQHVNTELKKMEEAALKAYHKDLASNPDLSARSFVKNAFASKVIEQAAANPKAYKSGESAALQAASSLQGNAPGPSLPLLPAPKVWHEAQTPEGYSYYWNVVTNETTWEAPEEGFVSILDQQLEELKKATEEESQVVAVEPTVAKKKKKKKKKKEGQFNPDFDREEEEEEEPEDASGYDPSNPYGQWQTVEKPAPQGPVDLQLPKIKFNQAKPPVASASSTEPKIRFTEKTTASAVPVASFVKREPGESEFKKRKIDDAKKNLRTRDTDN